MPARTGRAITSMLHFCDGGPCDENALTKSEVIEQVHKQKGGPMITISVCRLTFEPQLACCSWFSRPNDHHRALDARIHLDPPGSISRSIVSRTFLVQLNGLRSSHRIHRNCLAFIGRQDCVPVSSVWCVAVSPMSSRPSISLHRDVSSSDRSRCCRCQHSSSLHGFLTCACQGSPCFP